MRTRPALGLVAATVLLAVSACGGNDTDSSKDKASDQPTSQESATDQPDAAAPDLKGIPDVVATVNGEDITKDEFVALYTAQFTQASQQAQMTGQAPDEKALKKQTVDNLVDTELLTQEATSRGISVSDKDVDAELDDLATQYDMGSAKELIAALDEQGTTEDQARDQVETQVMIEQLVTDEKGSLEPTDKELRALYAKVKKQQEQTAQEGQEQQKIPPFAEVKDQLAEQAKTEALGRAAGALVAKLRKDADIKVTL